MVQVVFSIGVSSHLDALRLPAQVDGQCLLDTADRPCSAWSVICMGRAVQAAVLIRLSHASNVEQCIFCMLLLGALCRVVYFAKTLDTEYCSIAASIVVNALLAITG